MARTAALRRAGGQPDIRWLWWVLGVLVLAELAYQFLGVRGADALFNTWLHGGLLFAAAALTLGRVAVRPDARGAWLAFGLGLLAWAAGDTIWSVGYSGDASPSAVSFADAFWLAWYPLAILGLGLLVRHRVPRFDLHRWVDGIAAVLLLAIPWTGLVLEPAAEESKLTGADAVVSVVYPLADFLLFGALVGVFALMAWRPGRVWFELAAGIALMTVADAASAVQILETAYHPGVYDFFWPAAALLIGYAAWQPSPGELHPARAVGWRAIALPVAAQAVAAAIQILALFTELGVGERVLTVLVIIIATVQIVISRPQAGQAPGADKPAPRAR